MTDQRKRLILSLGTLVFAVFLVAVAITHFRAVNHEQEHTHKLVETLVEELIKEKVKQVIFEEFYTTANLKGRFTLERPIIRDRIWKKVLTEEEWIEMRNEIIKIHKKNSPPRSIPADIYQD